MARRRVTKEKIRKIQSSKGSYYITMPIKIMRNLKWRERQKVVVEQSGKGIKIKDWKRGD